VEALLIRDDADSLTWKADLMQAAYFLERLGALRLDAEASRAKLYVDLQRTVNAGKRARAYDLRGLLRAKEAEAVTLDRMAEAVLDRLVALRSHFGLPP
jgi:hypothetical protein